MSFWKNRHVLVATLMAPVLGLVSYFGFGALFGEKPLPAEAGRSYHLIEKPNCRYSSGICGLKNVDFELTLRGEEIGNDRFLLKLVSENPIDGVKLALVEDAADEGTPVDMLPAGNDGLNWTLEIKRPDPQHDRLRLVAASRQTLYFGDVATKFTSIEPEDESSK
ncbi:MAG TPA: hypothetical protein VIS57_12275 [Xanthomonadales bacterium]